jgi:hypothetical protein
VPARLNMMGLMINRTVTGREDQLVVRLCRGPMIGSTAIADALGTAPADANAHLSDLG